ncbi:MAG: OB-fold nucleic acid binding domain-containing protein, partial [Planctomycetes bacterium]|nr:OB-fold nucleic acid binding domain-containing protein [Planctomycetota bacterium]
MSSVLVSELTEHVGQEVTLQGWLYNRRGGGKLLFMQFRDGSGIVQAVVSKKEVPEQVFADSKRIGIESSIRITGTVAEDTRSKLGVELHLTNLEIISECSDYPIQISDDTPNVDKLLDQRHLWVRSRRPHAILKIRSEVVQAIRDFYYD